jgi:hypothetical protein
MNVDTLQALVSVAGLVITVIGLPVVILQLRGLQRSLSDSAHASIYEQGADFRAHLVEHSHLRRYFFDNAEIDSDHQDYERVLTIAELFLNYLEHIAVMMDSFGRRNQPALERFVRNALGASAVLRKRLAENREGYSDALVGFLSER